ncbi:hypothetical protein R1flu_018182 [Riccia fluitans]|uniref:Uncharacterized protein n=1 Tax=Riccia fluitans TaxID=41844 RepID=A0ABD1ZF39_9MARC
MRSSRMSDGTVDQSTIQSLTDSEYGTGRGGLEGTFESVTKRDKGRKGGRDVGRRRMQHEKGKTRLQRQKQNVLRTFGSLQVQIRDRGSSKQETKAKKGPFLIHPLIGAPL